MTPPLGEKIISFVYGYHARNHPGGGNYIRELRILTDHGRFYAWRREQIWGGEDESGYTIFKETDPKWIEINPAEECGPALDGSSW